MSIKHEVMNWDRKSASDIEQIYVAYQQTSEFESQLIDLCLDESLSVGGTWLVKFHIEHGGSINAQDMQKVLTKLPTYDHWESKLHILQVLSHFEVSCKTRKVLEPFLKHGLSDTNKFVRAWSFNGLYELAVQYPELQQEVTDLLNLALKNEPASVKARVRKLLKKGF